MTNTDFAKCNGCRHFEDRDWVGCIARVGRTGLDECYNPAMEKRRKCGVCGNRFIWTERGSKLYCRTCWESMAEKEVTK